MYATHRTGLDDIFSGLMDVLRHKALRLGAVLLLGFMVSACATAPDPNDKEAVAEYNEINDPLEPFNRAMFEFNRGLDTLVLRPVAAMYRGFVPPPVRELVSNFLSNLKTPVILLNDVLQGETDRAMNTLSRFAINTTVGVLGFGDPATDMGYPAHKEDFGQTLATWGVDGGPYLVLPILGPSNPRDAVGKVVDVITDPIWHYAQNTDKEYIPNQRFVADAVDFRLVGRGQARPAQVRRSARRLGVRHARPGACLEAQPRGRRPGPGPVRAGDRTRSQRHVRHPADKTLSACRSSSRCSCHTRHYHRPSLPRSGASLRAARPARFSRLHPFDAFHHLR